jgi:hypothetical protein
MPLEGSMKSDTPAAGSLWRHKERQKVYQVVSIGRLQTAACPGLDMAPCVAYISHPKSTFRGTFMWFRTVDEFLDGRFEQVK